jgi:uncharacterized membrane protein
MQAASACPFCNPQIREAIYDERFLPNLAIMLSAFFVLGGIVALLSVIAGRRHKANILKTSATQPLNPVPLLTTAIILGIGIGGFIDGIVLHQILQWHEMLSARIPPTNYVGKSVNMFWDGIFHAFTLIVTFIGIVQLWALLRRENIDRSGYRLSGGLLMGWGLFNVVEGIIDHQLLKLHNVKEISDNPEAWNLGFLGFSLVLLLAGYLLTKKRSAALSTAVRP